MIRKSTFTLVVIFLVLGLLAYFLPRTNWFNTETDAFPTSTESPIVMNLGNMTISAFTMIDDQGRVFKASLNNQQTWSIDLPLGCQYDSGQIASSLSLLQTFKVMVSMESLPALADVGLVKPTYRLALTFTDGTRKVLSVGSIVPTGTGYYVQVDNEPVVVVNKSAIDSLFELVGTACATPTPEPTATIMPELTQIEGMLITVTPAP